MTNPTTEWNMFEQTCPNEFSCLWCSRTLHAVDGLWKHEDGRACMWADFPLEVSHPFVSALLARIVSDGMDLHGRMTEFGRVLSMFRPAPRPLYAAA